MSSFEIAGRLIGPGHPCFIIAEAGVNHNGDMDVARRLIEAAVEAGADAVKFQTFRAEHLVTRDAPQAEYQRRNVGKVESQYDMLKRLELPEQMHCNLIRQCRDRGIVFLSTPFEEASAELLESLDIPAFKVPSGEITNTLFLEYIARKNRPVILSTGMSTLEEVREAVACIRHAGNQRLALLHCVSNYPAEAGDINLRAMNTMKDEFGLPVGYSDHTDGTEIALAAIALGACIIEKHFTLDRNLPGPDHKASLEPGELAAMVSGIRRVEAALGDGIKQPAASEAGTAAVARKSIVAALDLPSGAILEASMMAIRRPGTGISAARFKQVLGRRLRAPVREGELVREDVLED